MQCGFGAGDGPWAWPRHSTSPTWVPLSPHDIRHNFFWTQTCRSETAEHDWLWSVYFISSLLQRQGEARPTFLWHLRDCFLYIQLVNIPKILRFYRKKWKIKNQQICYNLHFKKGKRNDYLKTILHTQPTANLPDFNSVLGKNSLLANHLRYKFFGSWFLEFHELLSLWKTEIWKWRHQRLLLPVSHTELPECTFFWAVVSTGCQGANATYIYHVTAVPAGPFLFHIIGHSWGGQKQVSKKPELINMLRWDLKQII